MDLGGRIVRTDQVDQVGGAQLAETYGVQLPPLIYAGQAGATSSKAGVERGATLLSRIKGNHLGGNIRSSTFRRTLAASLFEPLGLRLAGPSKLEPASNAALSAWMRAHLSLATVACRDRATLSELEDAVLAELDPPLNPHWHVPHPGASGAEGPEGTPR